VSHNDLISLPSLAKLSNLSVLNVGHNQLEDISAICHESCQHLAEVSAPRNKICQLPAEIAKLPALKKLDLSANCLKDIPGELSSCQKLKELHLAENPLKDNRLKKMVAQKGTKAVLDYISQHCAKV